MGLPFYGRFWENVGGLRENTDDPMWRYADLLNGKVVGGAVEWADLDQHWNTGKYFLMLYAHKLHTSYLQ